MRSKEVRETTAFLGAMISLAIGEDGKQKKETRDYKVLLRL